MGTLNKKQRRDRIKRRSGDKVAGTAARPRLSVFRSNKEIYAQVIDDESGCTLVTASSLGNKSKKAMTKTEQAKTIGQTVAQKAIKAGISQVVFDRSGYLYHGRIKSLAEAAREEGLKF